MGFKNLYTHTCELKWELNMGLHMRMAPNDPTDLAGRAKWGHFWAIELGSCPLFVAFPQVKMKGLPHHQVIVGNFKRGVCTTEY